MAALEVAEPLRASFERDEDGAAILHATVVLVNNGDAPQHASLHGALSLADANGAPVRLLGTSQQASLAAGATYPLDMRFAVSSGEFDSADRARFALACVDGLQARLFTRLDPVPLAQAKQELFEADAARAQAQRVAAWRERFPVGDYSDVLLIGDSLMQNAAAALRDAMPGATVNADAGRTLETGGLVFEDSSPEAGILDHVRKDTGAFSRYVIGAPNNDVGGLAQPQGEEIVSRLGDSAEIYFVTQLVVGNPSGTAVTNDTVAALVDRHSNVHAVDWRGLVAGREAEYLSDGCHPRRDREPDYAACIKDALDVAYERD